MLKSQEGSHSPNREHQGFVADGEVSGRKLPETVPQPDHEALSEDHLDTVTLAHIAKALTRDYFCIYCIDLLTDRFVERVAHERCCDLGIGREGGNFFGTCRTCLARKMGPDDQQQFLDAFTKENVVRVIETCGAFSLACHLTIDGKPTFVHMKAARMDEESQRYLVVGISSIDAQMHREQNRAMALRPAWEAAYRDQLTGVKSKLAYAKDIGALEARMVAGKAEAFALVLCDINDLKAVNDTRGHTAGDELIRAGCHQICVTFSHSPVYRYGGDEFVAILRGSDYERRDSLMRQMADHNRGSADGTVAIVACGMAVYQPGIDTCVMDVFERADAAMYEDKRRLKSLS